MSPDGVRRFLVGRGAPVAFVAADAAIFSTGLVDSFLLVDLLAFLEAERGGVIDPATLTLADIDTLDSLARLGGAAEAEEAP